MKINCIWNEASILGEGPLWHPIENVLYWVDIVKPALHRLNPKTGAHRSWLMPSEIGCIGWCAENKLIGAFRQGFGLIDLPSGNITLINEPIKNRTDVMFNDGKCDRKGRFWAGTKDVQEELPLGSLYRLDSNNISHEMAKGFTVSNGVAWNIANTRMYICDSPARKIYYYDFDFNTGNISHQQIFATIPTDAGYPDGLTIDSEDHIWSAHWDGWRITRYTPNGKIDRVIEMPVQRPTSCCFGGDNFETLYITSARVRLSEHELAKQPLAGNLFAIDVGIRGLAEPSYCIITYLRAV